MKPYHKSYKDCYIAWEGDELRVGNQRLERVWSLAGHIPTIRSLTNKMTGKEWLTTEETYDWLPGFKEKYAFFHSAFVGTEKLDLTIEADTDDDCGIARKHLRVQVSIAYKDCYIKWIHLIYPETALLRSFIQITLKDGVTLEERVEQSADKPAERAAFQELSDDFRDSYPLEPRHAGWKSVEFVDVTDDFDNLLFTRQGLFSRRERRFVKGNLLFVQDHLSKDGLTLIKEGPTPLDYLGGIESDFFIRGMNVCTTGWGFGINDLDQHRTLTSYGSAVLLWNGEEKEALSALNNYHNAIHVFNADKDAFIMSNTWGDQSSDGRLSEQFLLDELEASRTTGISFYQIDDGWQNGTTANSVLPGGAWGKGYYKHNPDFWKVNDRRFPNGLEPIIASAKEKGIKLGLWFSPDSIHDFENWEKDSQVLIDLHHQYGIAAFKMDGIEFTSKAGEENLNRLLRNVLQGTDGKVFFNMDVTAGTRSGYYGQLQYGSLFLENRFTGAFGSWPNYFPHCTLRNIWMLSRYYPTYRLQAEFLNVKRNIHLYKGDPLAPSACGIEYAFAITMFANPLAWMEQTGLDDESMAILGRIIPVYRQVQSDILAGHVLPIGEEPSGTGWTGFQSITSNRSGYLLLIKESNSDRVKNYQLWNLKNTTLQLTCILGSGIQEAIDVDREGNAAFQMDGVFQYALYRYQLA